MFLVMLFCRNRCASDCGGFWRSRTEVQLRSVKLGAEPIRWRISRWFTASLPGAQRCWPNIRPSLGISARLPCNACRSFLLTTTNSHILVIDIPSTILLKRATVSYASDMSAIYPVRRCSNFDRLGLKKSRDSSHDRMPLLFSLHLKICNLYNDVRSCLMNRQHTWLWLMRSSEEKSPSLSLSGSRRTLRSAMQEEGPTQPLHIA